MVELFGVVPAVLLDTTRLFDLDNSGLGILYLEIFGCKVPYVGVDMSTRGRQLRTDQEAGIEKQKNPTPT